MQRQTGVISLMAGTPGIYGYSGDGGLAINAQFKIPRSLLFIDNYVYIADSGNSLVRRIDKSTGIITRVAGTPGTGSSSGYGGDALQCSFASVTSIAYDSKFNLLFVNDDSKTILFINVTSNIIYIFAEAPNTNINYVDSLSVEDLSFCSVQNMAIDSDNSVLYFADRCSSFIRGISAYKCNTGWYGNLPCSECTPGYFNSKIGNSRCISCSPGQYSNTFASFTCQPCAAGYFTFKDGETECTPCPPSTYSSSASSRVCSPCPIGTFNAYNRSTSVTDCMPCP